MYNIVILCNNRPMGLQDKFLWKLGVNLKGNSCVPAQCLNHVKKIIINIVRSHVF